jgi:hypothetical protein
LILNKKLKNLRIFSLKWCANCKKVFKNKGVAMFLLLEVPSLGALRGKHGVASGLLFPAVGHLL